MKKAKTWRIKENNSKCCLHILRVFFVIALAVMTMHCLVKHVYAEEYFAIDESVIIPDTALFFYNIEGGAGSSDMILVKNGDHWGLIDAGHRYETEIEDEDGTVWRTDVSGLSCQIDEKNGRDGMLYMIEALQIDHLDFIIATHSHSDHIGGIPEIADLLVGSDKEEEGHSLIDETTAYFYKTYYHTGPQDDDLGDEIMKYSWHNQAFYYQAVSAVEKRGGRLIDISCGVKAAEGEYLVPDQTHNIAALGETGNFSNIAYDARSATNAFDDVFSFSWGG